MLACHDACLTAARGDYRQCTSSATGAFQDAVSVNGQQFNGNVSRVFDFADPMIGVRWGVPLLDRLSLDFRGDLGGLPTGSKLTWVWSATCATGRTCRCSRRSRGWRRGTG
jgi:hypothetical protein